MYLKICDNTQAIRAVQAYIARIKNTEKKRYAQDFWDAVYNESAHGTNMYPNGSNYKIGPMTIQTVQLRIQEIISDNKVQ